MTMTTERKAIDEFKRKPSWETPGTTTEMIDGMPFPRFPRPDGPIEGDRACEAMSSVHGHFNCIWNPNIPSEVADAKRSFESAKTDGRRPFNVGPDGKETTPMGDTFDPNVGKMIILPRITGG